jgi:hypothetical protein
MVEEGATLTHRVLTPPSFLEKAGRKNLNKLKKYTSFSLLR